MIFSPVDSGIPVPENYISYLMSFNRVVLSAEEAVKKIKSGDRAFLHGSAATPVHWI